MTDRDYKRKFGYAGTHGEYLKAIKLKAKRDFQIRMLRCLASGLTTDEMSIVLNLTRATCETYRIRLMKELHARNSCQAIKVAYDSGLLFPGEHYENGEVAIRKAS